jgi:hypothetical protein
MPNAAVKSFADQTGKPLKEVEALWNQAKQIAGKKFKESNEKFYQYTMGIFKRSLGISASQTILSVSTTTGALISRSGCSCDETKDKGRFKVWWQGPVYSSKILYAADSIPDLFAMVDPSELRNKHYCEGTYRIIDDAAEGESIYSLHRFNKPGTPRQELWIPKDFKHSELSRVDSRTTSFLADYITANLLSLESTLSTHEFLSKLEEYATYYYNAKERFESLTPYPLFESSMEGKALLSAFTENQHAERIRWKYDKEVQRETYPKLESLVFNNDLI